jgi:hypothetical protein
MDRLHTNGQAEDKLTGSGQAAGRQSAGSTASALLRFPYTLWCSLCNANITVVAIHGALLRKALQMYKNQRIIFSFKYRCCKFSALPSYTLHHYYWRRKTADGRWQIAEGRRQVADGRLQTADGRRQKADRRPQTADGRWQMADGRQETTGGRKQTAVERK